MPPLDRLRWRALSLRVKGLAVLAIPVVFLVMTAAFVYVSDLQHEEASEAVARTRAIEAGLHEALIALNEAETSVRGFLLTGEREWLARYERRRDELPALLGDLRGLVRDPRAAADLKALESVAEQRLALLAAAADSPATALVSTETGERLRRGQVLMDQLRALAASIDGRQDDLLAEREARRERAARFTRVSALVGGAVGTGIGILVALLFAAGVARRVGRLERNAAHLAAGEALEAPPAGEDEVARLGRRLQEAAVLLRQRQQALQQAHDSLDRFFTLSPDLLCIAGFDGYFKRLNPAWSITLGWTEDELRAAPFVDFVHPDDRDATSAEVDRQARGDSVISFENRYQCKDGSYRWLQWNSVPLASEGLIYAAARDVTERRRADEQIRQLNDALTRQNVDLAALNRELEAFTCAVSHDLRAPLRAIDGFSQALLEDHAGRLDAEGQDFLRRARAAAQRMAELIDALLTLSRISRAGLQREQVSLTDLSRTVVGGLRDHDPGRGIDVTIAPDLVVEGDGRLLRVVMENLLANAWKYTAKHPAARIEVGAFDKDGRRVYYVRDNGVGFDMAHAGKLFGAFQRLHSAHEYPGTGVGLATVQRIVHRHGGDVWAEGSVGNGATFYFTLERPWEDA